MIGFGGDPGFDVTFSIMRIMVPVMFVLVFGIIIVTMVVARNSGTPGYHLGRNGQLR